MEKKNKMLKILFVINMLIVILTTHYIFDAVNIISYASGTNYYDNTTNHSNIKFSCSIDSENQKMNNEEMKMFISVEVQNEGLFNGTINLENSNFKFKQNLKDGMSEITENKIVLNQINATSKIDLEVDIESIKDDLYKLENLNKENLIRLEGIYVRGENKQTEIEANKKVRLNFVNPYIDTEYNKAEIKSEIITNKIFNIDNEEKRIVQLYVESGIKDNIYPIKESQIKITILNSPEKVEVLSRGTYETNNWQYDKENGILQISIENKEESGYVSWNKDKKDEFIINLTYDKDVDLSQNKVQIEDKIQLYDGTSILEGEVTLENINEQKQNIINYEINMLQDSIYKGKLYSKEETTFETISKIDIRYKGISNNIKIQEDVAEYEIEGTENIVANGGYKNSKINKQSLINVLGEKGELILKDLNDNIIAKINKDTKENENGEITINYENQEKLILEIKNAENSGEIEIKNTMFIKEKYGKEVLNLAKKLKVAGILESTNGVSTKSIDNTLELVESISRAELKMENAILSTNVNQNVEIKAELYTGTEQFDLFKNPKIVIKLPEEITDIKINQVKLLYEEELQVNQEEIIVDTINENQKIIKMTLNGEQTSHNSNIAINGANLVINCDLTLDPNTTKDSGEIVMAHSNENAHNYYNNAVSMLPIKYVLPIVKQAVKADESVSPIILTKEISAGNGNDIYERQVQKFTITIKNNTSEVMQNIIIKDTIPEEMVYATEISSKGYQNTWKEQEEIKEFTKEIEKLEASQEMTMEYYVITRKSSENVGKTIQTKAVAIVGEESYESNIVENTIKEADLQIFNVVRDNNVESYFVEDAKIEFIVKVKNITNEKLNNIEVKNYVPEEMEYITSSYMQYDEEVGQYYEDPDEIIENNNYNVENKLVTWNIESLDINEEKAVKMIFRLGKITVNEDIAIVSNQASAVVNEVEYPSNIVQLRQMAKIRMDIKLESNLEDTYIYEGDEFEYKVTITNTNENLSTYIELIDQLPKGLIGKELSYMSDGEETTISIGEDSVNILLEMLPKETKEIIIKVEADKLEEGQEELEIRNTVKITGIDIQDLTSNELVNIIKKKNEPVNPDNPDDPEKPDNPDDPEKPDNPDDPEKPEDKKYSISGLAWLDENKNGSRDLQEDEIKGLEVRLLDANTGEYIKDKDGNIIKQITNDKGQYTFTELKVGKYIVLFIYDNEKYSITEYQKFGVNEILNSDVISSEKEENNTMIKVGLTDSIVINDSDVSNIDIGLVENKIFDLKLEKFINKVVIKTNNETIIKGFNDISLAKIELNAKTINQTSIEVEYEIKITNEGEIMGYGRKIADYLPNELEFNSSLNKDWKEQNGMLVNTKLQNVMINPGESKSVKLVLTKKLNDDSTGTITNTAEILEAYNEKGIEDIDSVSGNKKTGEDDISSANLIISIGTGKIILYISFILSMIIVIGVGIYFIKKKVLGE